MKFVLSAFVFFLALGLSLKSVASTPKNSPETCTAETQNCEATKEAHSKHKGAENAHGNGLSEHMNSLFPEKQKNPTVTARPTSVKLTSPKFLAKVSTPTVKLEWAAADGATSYHVQVATDPNFKWLVTNEHFVKTTSYDMANLQPGQKYYWRIASLKGENDSSFTKSLFISSVFATPAVKQ